jgi:hypothetical protein
MPGLLPPCHGLSTFLVELVAFDIGKVEISQYYLTRLRTEKSKYYNYNPTFFSFLVNGKVEILHYHLTACRAFSPS